MALHYYHHWLAALERLVTERGLADKHALSARKDAWEDAYLHNSHGSPVELSSFLSRQLVVRADDAPSRSCSDGRTFPTASMDVVADGCACAGSPDAFKEEWLRRKLRKVVHLTKAGCLGPCAVANVASLVFDGRAIWFHQ
jgi:hypothetical protein